MLQVTIPKALAQQPPAKEAWVFKVTSGGK